MEGNEEECGQCDDGEGHHEPVGPAVQVSIVLNVSVHNYTNISFTSMASTGYRQEDLSVTGKSCRMNRQTVILAKNMPKKSKNSVM